MTRKTCSFRISKIRSAMGNTLHCFPSEMWGLKKDPTEHSALKVYVVLKGIFRHLSDSELGKVRRVDRQWNFAAMSELVRRKLRLSTIKLYSFSSNQFRDRDYAWYLDFENSRRSLWTELYETDCPGLQFYDLHFSYPEETEEFSGILELPWLASVTSLTLSMFTQRTSDLTKRFLPSFPNLRTFCCSIKPDVVAVDSFVDLANISSNPNDNTKAEASLLPLYSAEVQEQRIYSNLQSVIIRTDENCHFPWFLLNSFPALKNLELQFGDPTSLIECSDYLAVGNTPWEIDSLEITLIHKPDLEEQVKEAVLHSETFAAANAKLCNLFRPRVSLGVDSMIPTTHFFVFLNELQEIMTSQVMLEIAAPCFAGMAIPAHELMYYLIPAIGFKFSGLKQLRLQYLQYTPPEVPLQFVGREVLKLDHRTIRKLEKIHIRTVPSAVKDSPDGITLPYAHYGLYTLDSFGIEMIYEIIFEVSGWFDSLVFLAIPSSVRKLTFRGTTSIYKSAPKISGWFYFPQLDWPDYPKGGWFDRMKSAPDRGYAGLLGLQSLEVFCLEGIKLLYSPQLASEIRKMSRLKSIYLDAEFNEVVPQEKLPRSWSLKWPSAVERVQIRAK